MDRMPTPNVQRSRSPTSHACMPQNLPSCSRCMHAHASMDIPGNRRSSMWYIVTLAACMPMHPTAEPTKALANTCLLATRKPGWGSVPTGCFRLLCSRWAVGGSSLVSPLHETNNPCALSNHHATRLNKGARPMELVSMAY